MSPDLKQIKVELTKTPWWVPTIIGLSITAVVLVLLLLVYMQDALQVKPREVRIAVQELQEELRRIETKHAEFVKGYYDAKEGN